MSCTIRQVTTGEARAFWLQQADARIFLHPDVLEPMCQRVDWWLGEWDGNPVCLWPICLSFDGEFRPPELSSYVGPLWAGSVADNKAHRWWTITRSVQDAMLAHLVEHYCDFMFELPPGTSDIRVFQWFQTEHEDSHDVSIQTRHTSYMNRPSKIDRDSIVGLFSRDRMRDARDAMDYPYHECGDPGADEIFDLYAGLLAGKKRADAALRRRREIHALVDAVQRGFGNIVACRSPSGSLASFRLVMGNRSTVVAPVTASSECARKNGLQAWVRLHAVVRAFEQGACRLDFAGGNSRIGAEDMHRYGTLPEIYFRIRVVRR